MKIYVNDNAIDAQLTDEKNMAQVYDAISSWTRANNKYILTMKVDSREVSPDSLSKIDIDSVNRVDIEIGDELDIMVSAVDEAGRYVDQIGASLFERSHLTAEEIKDLLDGTDWITETIDSSCKILRLDPTDIMCPVVGENGAEAKSIREMLSDLKVKAESIQSNDPSTIQVYLATLRDLRFFILKLRMQLMTLNAGLEELVEKVEEFELNIPELSKEIVQINELFQTGHDLDALEALDQMTEKLSGYLSAVFATEYRLMKEKGVAIPQSAGTKFTSVADAITGILKDLSSAMEDSDIVAVGDILEYELTARLTELQPFLSSIRQILVAGK